MSYKSRNIKKQKYKSRKRSRGLGHIPDLFRVRPQKSIVSSMELSGQAWVGLALPTETF